MCVKAPGFGDRRKEMLQDIAILTGGRSSPATWAMSCKDATMELSSAAPARSRSPRRTPPSSTAPATSEAIADRVAQIRSQIDVTTSDFDREKLQERLAKLAGGVAVIKVGAATEVEMKEKKLRIEDALNATKAAVEEGIVAGGGTAYSTLFPLSRSWSASVEGDEKTGVKIVRKALESSSASDCRQRWPGGLRYHREHPDRPASSATASTPRRRNT